MSRKRRVETATLAGDGRLVHDRPRARARHRARRALRGPPLGNAARPAAAVVLARAAGALAGGLIEDWTEIVGGVIGGWSVPTAAAIVVSGALRRGGTRGGLALIVAAVAVGLAGLAFVPVVGYLMAVAVPTIALRLRRTQSERYAGLRTLAKD